MQNILQNTGSAIPADKSVSQYVLKRAGGNADKITVLYTDYNILPEQQA
jgi:hypothetical protein